MIFDTVSRIGAYRGISKNLDTAIDCIEATDFTGLAEGRYEVDGDNVYYMVQKPALKPREVTKWEVHRRYIDIQLALVPGESIGYAPMAAIDGWQDYQPEKDVQLATSQEPGVALPMGAREFAIFFPWDAHRPTEKNGGVGEGHKVVVKVLVG